MGYDKSSQADFLITAAGIWGQFDRKDAVETSANARRYRDGGQKVADIMTDPQEHGDLTISRAWHRATDISVTKTLRARVGSWSTTITVQPLKNGVRSGAPIRYTGKLIKVTDPAVDSNGTEPASLSITFAISSIS